MRFFCAMFIALLSFSSYALMPEKASRISQCPHGALPSEANFCSTFKSVAFCHCVEMGIPQFVCKNMNTLYNAMILRFGSMERACEYQKDTSKQVCMDSWGCYRSGGKDSVGNLCSGTGKTCE